VPGRDGLAPHLHVGSPRLGDQGVPDASASPADCVGWSADGLGWSGEGLGAVGLEPASASLPPAGLDPDPAVPSVSVPASCWEADGPSDGPSEAPADPDPLADDVPPALGDGEPPVS
jgi:hypothetical protein